MLQHLYEIFVCISILVFAAAVILPATTIPLLERGLLLLASGFAAWVGGRLGYYWLATSKQLLHQPWIYIVEPLYPGFSIIGALPTVVLTGYLYCRYLKISWRAWLDLLGPAVLGVLPIVRMGCWLNGCCFGRPLPVSWRNSITATWFNDRFPTQLIEALASLFFLLLILRTTEKLKPVGPTGVQGGWCLITYLFIRMLNELWRGENIPSGNYRPLMALITLLLLALAIGKFYFANEVSSKAVD
jgi:phosphatidylglycerol:prolipoprotein diacylglycerol transferase